MSNNLFSGQSSTTGSIFGQQSSNNNGGNNSNQQSNTTSSPFSSASLFGGLQNQSATTQSPFPSTTSAPSTGGFSFGNNKPEEKKNQGNANPFNAFSTPNKDSSQDQTSGLFGQQASSTPSAFANPSTTPAGPPPTNSLFGNLGQTQKSTTSLFGSAQQNNQQTDQSSQKSTNLFANNNSASPFGTTPSSGNTNSLFGKPASTTASGTPTETPKSLFGSITSSAQQASAPSSTTLFGKPAAPTASGTPTEAPKSLFGNTNSSSHQTSAPPSNTLFAQSKSAPVTSSPFSFPGLGQNNAQSSGQATPTTTATDKPSPLLGGSAATTAGGSSSLFPSSAQNQNGQTSEAQQTQAQGTTAPASNLFAGLGQKKDDKPQAQTSSLFAGLGQNKDKDTSNAQDEAKKSSAPSFSPFQNANQNKDKDAAATSAPASSSTAATTGVTASAPGTTAASSGGLFGGAPGNQQETSTSKTPEASGLGSSTLGASTAGPAPTPQSRLKNKSMDEIITRWATDLSKYQKEFQAQAEKVAAWDRMLLENSNAISTLYSKTYHAERDTAEVQKQLSTVEGHQDELSHWLDRYEREVDEMMARQVGQGESLQGPDQERERTYKIAGRVSERLDEMGKDLTSMIDEINDASATISKTSKPDDPLSQIVRVLNGHLSQLQLIDQGAAELRGRIDAAQKEKSRLGSRANSSFANSDVDNFYRSYMKRG